MPGERLRLSCVQAMPIFQGSLVDGLLNELSTRLSLAPELIETFDLSDVRFHLGVRPWPWAGAGGRDQGGRLEGAQVQADGRV